MKANVTSQNFIALKPTLLKANSSQHKFNIHSFINGQKPWRNLSEFQAKQIFWIFIIRLLILHKFANHEWVLVLLKIERTFSPLSFEKAPRFLVILGSCEWCAIWQIHLFGKKKRLSFYSLSLIRFFTLQSVINLH